jgi:hypothetical protein
MLHIYYPEKVSIYLSIHLSIIIIRSRLASCMYLDYLCKGSIEPT